MSKWIKSHKSEGLSGLHWSVLSIRYINYIDLTDISKYPEIRNRVHVPEKFMNDFGRGKSENLGYQWKNWKWNSFFHFSNWKFPPILCPVRNKTIWSKNLNLHVLAVVRNRSVKHISISVVRESWFRLIVSQMCGKSPENYYKNKRGLIIEG